MKMNDEIKTKIQELGKQIQELKERLGFDEKVKEVQILEEKVQAPDFWQKGKEAAAIQKKFSQLKKETEEINTLENEIKDLQSLLSLAKNSREEEEIKRALDKAGQRIKEKNQHIFLSGKYDKNSAILSIQAGVGGRDAEDWAVLLLGMYTAFSNRKGFRVRNLYQQFGEGGGPEGRIGLKESSAEIRGKFAYGILKKENGVHRLVRISPFSNKGLRQTSFVKVEVLPKIEREEDVEVKLRPEDLRIDTFRASGHGGQNVNRRESAVRITHLPTGLTAECQNERLQGLNRKIAVQVLLSKLIAREEKGRKEEMEKIRGEKISPDFGSQIRSYVLHPYQLVKDHRTGVETPNVEAVLDGDLEDFIEAEIKI